MEPISVFDMLKVGIGPSSSHTLGPWRAAERFVLKLQKDFSLATVNALRIELYGSLALTGRGHGTDIAILLGLSGYDPETIPIDTVQTLPKQIETEKKLILNQQKTIFFDPKTDLIFEYTISLPFHANGMIFKALDEFGTPIFVATYYSIGGGFVVKEQEERATVTRTLPFPIQTGEELIKYCTVKDCRIADIVWKNEQAWRTKDEIRQGLLRIWQVMKECVFRGCHTEGVLPGGLQVRRRAAEMYRKLSMLEAYDDIDHWIGLLKKGNYHFSQILKWIGCFAMAVNEENANFGRIVTAPTNGASGVIPAVLFYYLCFSVKDVTEEDIIEFLMVAGEIGSIFKKGSTISAAMGGCQAEIGVSSAMAAAALTEGLGGSPGQALMAAEIAMEHHLGLTCDPVGGLVQIPCIERNSMGAIKAITAANIALESDPSHAKVSLDDVINTMWETAQDMNTKYKETSQGGLATKISILVPEC